MPSLSIAGSEFSYTAEAARLEISDHGRGDMFYVAYTRDDVKGPRPVSFVFNGGPGAASIWLHLGLVGPKRIATPDSVRNVVAPVELLDNEYSILDLTDLVLIDPVSTGFSRPAEGEDPKKFHGYQEDLNSVGEFISKWTTKAGRWQSPKLIIGESYGAARAVGLADLLQSQGMNLNGVVLISGPLSSQVESFAPLNDLPYTTFLPSYAATAWYHGRYEAPDLSFICEVEDFAMGDYATVLMQQSRCDPNLKARVAKQFAAYTGLEPEELRVTSREFRTKLLPGKVLGSHDARFTGPEGAEPSNSATRGPYTAALNSYLREDLGFETNLTYEVYANVHPWNLETIGRNRFAELVSPLKRAMSANPELKVLSAGGYYDLVSPYFSGEWTIDHMGLDESLKSNITEVRYESGHMMYIHEPVLAEMRRDLAAFIESAT